MKKVLLSFAMLGVSSVTFASAVTTGESLYNSNYVVSHQSLAPPYKNTGFYMGGGILFDMTNASSRNGYHLNANHVGFNLKAGYLAKLNHHNAVGLSLAYSKLGNISINQTTTTTTNLTFNNISLLGQYQYSFDSGFTLNANGGYGRMFGEHVKRWMPVLGGSVSYMITSNVALTTNYQHYFGVSGNEAFKSDSSVPGFDTVSVGVNIYF
ncbi:outer membrane beta-barrel protein [Francisellaceae bacterium]|nr:outer membrane beta-barrel protein [Francisellaceae bacterium]